MDTRASGFAAAFVLAVLCLAEPAWHGRPSAGKPEGASIAPATRDAPHPRAMTRQADKTNDSTAARVLHILWRVIRIPLLAYVGLIVVLFVLQGCLVYHPTKEIEATPANVNLPYEPVRLKTSDGLEIAAWFVPANPKRHPEPRGVVLFCHGNAGNMSHRLHTLMLLNDLGFSTLIFDYRGYGQSQGSPSEKGTYLDAEAAWRYLLEERKVPLDRIVVHGRSLGGAIAAYLAAEHTPRLLILESSFTSVPDLGQEIYWFLPVRLLARIRYDTLERMKRIRCPVLVVHGRRDRTVPFRHGRRIFEAAHEPKELLELPAGHNEGFTTTAYETGLRAYFDRQLPLAPRPGPKPPTPPVPGEAPTQPTQAPQPPPQE